MSGSGATSCFSRTVASGASPEEAAPLDSRAWFFALRRSCKGAYILNLTGGNPALASVGTNVTQQPKTGKTTLRRPHCS